MVDIARHLRRKTSNNEYYPEVDGIRFLAISTMILFHASGYFNAKFDPAIIEQSMHYPLFNSFIASGQRGVQYFFVLSGFILALPFARHYLSKSPAISLKRYYLRRLTRLEPPYIITMVGLFVAMLALGVYKFEFLFPSLLASLVYMHGVIFDHVPYLTVVAWSLEVEVQFYLIAPLIFTIFRYSAVVRRVILLSMAGIFIVLQHIYGPGYLNLFYQIQYFLVGILLADFYVSALFIEKLKSNWFGPAAVIALIVMIYMPIYTSLLAALFFPLVIFFLYCCVLRNPIVKHVFSYKVFAVLGGMCYSVYLLHYPIISFVGRFISGINYSGDYLINLFVYLAIMIPSIFAISSVFYILVERPFMSSRWTDILLKKLTSKKSILVTAPPVNPYELAKSDQQE